jgi:hypothetical protein
LDTLSSCWDKRSSFLHVGKQKNQIPLELNNMVYSDCSVIQTVDKLARWHWSCALF